MARLLVCSDFRFRLDRWDVTDVRIDRFAVRLQLEETDPSPPGITNDRGSFQYLLRRVVRVQSPVNLVILL